MIGGTDEELLVVRWACEALDRRLRDEGRRSAVLDDVLRQVVRSRPEPSIPAGELDLSEDAGMALLLTLGDVARVLSVSVTTVERLIRSGALAACAIGRSVRVRRADLTAYIDALSPTRGQLGAAEQETA